MNRESIIKLSSIFFQRFKDGFGREGENYIKSLGIELFWSFDHYICWQLFDKEKHVVVQVQNPRVPTLSDNLILLLIPKDLALKICTLGELP